MRAFLKSLVIILGAAGLWRWLAWRRGAPPPVEPQSLILKPEEAQRPGRFLPLASIANLRDIGGYHTTDGQMVRWNRVYRGAALANLSPEDAAALHERGLKLVCDLRTHEEIAAAPDRMPHAGVEYLHLPALQETSRLNRLRIMLLERDRLRDTLVDAYTRIMIDNNAALFGTLLRRVADEDALPLLIHCTAGKDRTGIAVALLLRLLGVPEDTVIEDYSLSNLYYDYFRQVTRPVLRQLAYFGITEAEASPLLLADPATLRAMFRHLEARYGTVAQYLQTAAGLDAATIDRIRASLLTTP
ncbi:MAG: tyrosine-protein phosphatase [Anaerolineae bacterium]|jgi:protein-tyrosine phosphatase|nr:tyrosine-protein phosphatase [Anaerolineae bacterium]